LGCFFLVVIPVLARLRVAASHPHVTSYTYAASLFGHHPAERSALGEARELLGAVYRERFTLHFQAMCHTRVLRRCSPCTTVSAVIELYILRFFIEAKAKPILALVPNGEVWEDEVACRFWSVQVYHASNWGTGKNGKLLFVLCDSTMRHGPSWFQRRKQEVVGVHAEGNIGLRVLAIKDLELYDWWRIHRASISGGWVEISIGLLGAKRGTHILHRLRRLWHVSAVAEPSDDR